MCICKTELEISETFVSFPERITRIVPRRRQSRWFAVIGYLIEWCFINKGCKQQCIRYLIGYRIGRIAGVSHWISYHVHRIGYLIIGCCFPTSVINNDTFAILLGFVSALSRGYRIGYLITTVVVGNRDTSFVMLNVVLGILSGGSDRGGGVLGVSSHALPARICAVPARTFTNKTGGMPTPSTPASIPLPPSR